MFINGDLTMGENIGDMSGLEVAYEAYKMSLGGKPAPVIDGLTGDQRFFLAFAQAWRGEQRDDAIKTQVASDPHSPRRYRIIGPLRNLDAWYSAFDIKPGIEVLHRAGEARPHLVIGSSFPDCRWECAATASSAAHSLCLQWGGKRTSEIHAATS